MIAALLIPALALAFARPPMRECQTAADCVLVKHTYCGQLSSITLGQDAKWAAWEKKESDRERAEKKICAARPMDPRRFEAFCDNGKCAVRDKAPAAPPR